MSVLKPALLALLVSAAPAAGAPAAKCVQIYYDAVPRASPPYAFGRVHALHLQNLLGHFPDLQQYVIPIEKYRAGQLDRCAASFYVGTYFDNAVPEDFLRDFAATKSTAVWLGYNVWKLPPAAQARLWGVRYRALSTLDEKVRDAEGRPTFFKLFDYKGQTFEKYGEWDAKDPKRFDAAWELTLFDPVERGADKNVVAWARHNGRPGKRAAYVLARGGKWYVADSPFSYITEEDRYLIFADLLFDMLGEKPRRPDGAPKPALFRVEDVHPLVPAWQLDALADLLAHEKVPFSVAVIPFWVDALGVLKAPRRYALAPDSPAFVDFLRDAGDLGATFIEHGVTHAYGFMKNPWSGITGDDFEFWDRRANRPVARDSARFVVERLEDGLALLEAAGIRPSAWETPHYQASPLDYLLFAQLYSWNVGRVVYFPFSAKRPKPLPAALEMSSSGAAANGRRLRYLGRWSAAAPAGLEPSGQFFPYEIYGDVYGQRLIPENVGNVQPYMNEQVLKSVSIDDMIRILKRDSVLRDCWASFFVHPSMLDTTSKGGTGAYPGDGREIARLIKAAREAGYEFVDLKTWTAQNSGPIRPEPIEETP